MLVSVLPSYFNRQLLQRLKRSLYIIMMVVDDKIDQESCVPVIIIQLNTTGIARQRQQFSFYSVCRNIFFPAGFTERLFSATTKVESVFFKHLRLTEIF